MVVLLLFVIGAATKAIIDQLKGPKENNQEVTQGNFGGPMPPEGFGGPPNGKMPWMGKGGFPGGPPDDSSIHGIMNMLYKAPMQIHKSIQDKLKDENPWESVTPLAERYVSLVNKLAEMKPRKGGEESWKSLTAEQLKNAEQLFASIKKHEILQANESWNLLQKSCQQCHKAHR